MRFLITFSIISFFCTSAFGQYREYASQSGIGIPFFKEAIHKQYNDDLKSTDLLVMIQFLYDDLTFVKSDTLGFETDVEILFAIYDDKDNVLTNRTINKKLNAADFEETNSRTRSVDYKEAFPVRPGKYKVFVKVSDINSGKTTQRKNEVIVPDFSSQEISISDILFMQDAAFDEQRKVTEFTPSFGNNFNVREGHFFIYFDLYTKKLEQPIAVNYKINHEKYPAELDSSFTFTPQEHLNSFLIKIDRNELSHNKYTMLVVATQGEEEAKVEQNFSFYWSDVPGTIEDISIALDQMTYILPGDSISKYKDADFKAKQAFFERFWAEHDPDPSTARNELKNEYFRRVNYADQHFSAMGQTGWKTDRGRILIKFGFPDDVDRHPFEIDRKPYEMWSYYSLRKQFLFLDITGFGDYRLHPDYLEVEFQ